MQSRIVSRFWFCGRPWRLKLPTRQGESSRKELPRGLTDMKRHANKCVERHCELANKKTEQLYKVSTPFWDDHHFKKEELESFGELSKVCSRTVFKKCLYLARVGRPDMLGSVNKLARSVTKSNRSLWQMITASICHVGSTAQHCRLGLLQDPDCDGDLEDSESTSGGLLCIFWSRTFVPVSWMCKKQTSVSHSFYRIRNCFVGWWLKDGRVACSWLMGCGDRSVTFIKEYRITNPCMGQQETAPEITNQNPNNKLCFTLFDGSWTYFSWRRFTHGRNFRAWSLGLRNWSISFFTKPNQQIQRSGVTGKTVA